MTEFMAYNKNLNKGRFLGGATWNLFLHETLPVYQH